MAAKEAVREECAISWIPNLESRRKIRYIITIPVAWQTSQYGHRDIDYGTAPEGPLLTPVDLDVFCLVAFKRLNPDCAWSTSLPQSNRSLLRLSRPRHHDGSSQASNQGRLDHRRNVLLLELLFRKRGFGCVLRESTVWQPVHLRLAPY